MVSFNPFFRKLESLEVRAEGGERFLVTEIINLEQQVHRLPDSDQKRQLELRLAALNGRLAKVAQKAEAEHLAEARRLAKFKRRGF